MSYVRFSAHSDVYLFGTTDSSGRNVIECCGCQFCKTGPWPGPEPEPLINGKGGFTWVLEAYPTFSDSLAALRHLDAHKAAGHKVPDYAYAAIAGDDWLSGQQENERGRQE